MAKRPWRLPDLSQKRNLLSMNSIYGIKCVVKDIILIKNKHTAKELRNIRKDKSLKKTKLANDYCYYLLLQQDSTKNYIAKGTTDNIINDSNNIAYILLDKVTPSYFVDDSEMKNLCDIWQQEEQDDIDEFLGRINTRYRMAKMLWGTEVAEHIKKGEIRFGFSEEMCRMAYTENVYRESKESTPFGLATCYNFYEKKEKLYFIDNKLIGIQFRLGQTKWQR